MLADKRLLALTTAALLWLALIALAPVKAPALAAGPLVFLGTLQLWHGIYRIMFPRWRERGWWSQRPSLSRALSGVSADPSSAPRRPAEVFYALLQTVLGIAFVLGGLIVAIKAF